ncbi:cytochrome P450 [Daldinia loculata]|uniref:cytochrome P450 n=1 Tax=Daldinia loculata TaxID=103429 RepID=UPI0020C46543|nr:cytochrome P450 [Daldinia loculata]KAI1648382.1 cytochrome P450 [Daldinia loculata]
MSLIALSAALIAALWLAKILYRGISLRLRFRAMQAHGLPVPEPHSFLYGHIPLMKSLREGLPKDAHDTYVHRKLTMNWPKYFPLQKKCPPVIYLDLWPLTSQPFVYVTSPETCFQLTQQTAQPRHSMFSWALFPVTGGKDLISMDMPTHRIWRSRLNPGFSPKNILSQAPILIEEVDIFIRQLKEQAGKDGAFGNLINLYDRTVALTFDIIMRVSLDLDIGEQTRGPTPILMALRKLISYVKGPTIWSKLERWTPSYRQDVTLNSKILRDSLLPQIKSRLQPDASSEKTVIDLAVKEYKNEYGNENRQPSPDFINTVISQLKRCKCWVLYEINKSPEVLKRVREEHDEVLGSDAKLAAQVLSLEPHKLNSLRYTTAAIKESLRLHPLGSTHRRGSRGFNFVCEGTTYPTEDSVIWTSPTAVHLRSDLWPRVMEFLPERFLVAEGHPLHPVKNAWRPFELGNTRCIGEELVMVEMKLVLALTMRELDFKFDWEGWNTLQRRAAPPDSVEGEHIYRVGNGIGSVKDKLPTRIRLI